RIDLEPLIRTSDDVSKIGYRVRSLELRNPIKRWTVGLGTIYPDQWKEAAAKIPSLPPGVYAIEASGGGAVKRSWFAITNVALLTKRSRKELLVYSVDATSGRPVVGLALAATDHNGAIRRAATNSDGILSLRSQNPEQDSVWLYGMHHSGPAFLLS